MVEADLALDEPLVHDTFPRSARCGCKIVAPVSLLIGLASATVFISLHFVRSRAVQYPGIQSPISALASMSPAAVATVRAPARLSHGGMHGRHVVGAHRSGTPVSRLSMHDQCGAAHARRATVVTAAASQGAGDDVAAWIAEAGMGDVAKSQSMGASGWSSFSKITTTTGTELFVKTSSKSAAEMFKGEALGMQALYEATEPAGLMRIPKVYHFGDMAGGRGSFIIMEYMNLGSRCDDYELGRAMASMHLQEVSGRPGRFGFDVDNSIGATPQKNSWSDDWVEFYRDRRLRYQVELANDGYITDLFNSIAPRLGELFKDVDVKPSVLHGDLWSGNIGSADGKPSIFDPAVYIGHHEAEWGMSWCAGLGSEFWRGYRELIPEDPGFRARRPLYDAYHYLNHLNLFGGGYRGSASSALEQVKRTLDNR
eukprot:gnl/TRDRNA2_/TRDRNA2_27749_c0_seq1.p1 gnl/TRDRNA2_/TRDRNA2_27749_c0~~gnl/TRDRNA2_/TRDRNA2_27749_c0_seq1.p1  ORF type:complete len:426 (-),score=46.38 gnl/TRDRNA2_/TRDRNA2_27749_c0_seq1:15-1292(-)